MNDYKKEQLLPKTSESLSGTKPQLDFVPDFIPDDLVEQYNKSDLEYDYCVMKFTEMQAAKRDSISSETMRVWFKEFVRLKWDKYKFDVQFNALMTTNISGHAIRVDNWINAKKETVLSQDAYKPLPKITRKEKLTTAGIMRDLINRIDAGEFNTK